MIRHLLSKIKFVHEGDHCIKTAIHCELN